MTLDMDKEILKTLHVRSEELPFIEFQPGIETRLLHVRPSDKLVVTQIRAQPGAIAGLHRHPSPVYGWTLTGSWGHDRQFEYRPGSYIFETPGVIHQFLAGPEVAEAVFVSTGDVEFIDPATLEVSGTATPQMILDQYLQKCEALGLSAPVLR